MKAMFTIDTKINVFETVDLATPGVSILYCLVSETKNKLLGA